MSKNIDIEKSEVVTICFDKKKNKDFEAEKMIKTYLDDGYHIADHDMFDSGINYYRLQKYIRNERTS
jgi:predicted GNAT superfamily acetyltransferase